MAKRRRRRLKKGRIALALIILIAIIYGIVALITSLTKKDPVVPEYAPFPSFDNYGYKIVTMAESEIHKGELALVNYDYHYTAPAPEDLVSVSANRTKSYSVKDDSVQVREIIIPSFNSMMDDFVKATGLKNVVVISGHRTVEYQQMLYDRELEKTGNDSSDEVARPGESEHHTGLVVDLAVMLENDTSKFFDGEGDYGWVNENCHKYGFVIRYPDEKKDITKIIPEPWHYRYVGNVHAKVMTDNNLCLEEYIDFLKKYPYDGEHLEITVDDKNYEVYYFASQGESTQVYVPLNEPYTVSGNNVDGFVVTVELGREEVVSEENSDI